MSVEAYNPSAADVQAALPGFLGISKELFDAYSPDTKRLMLHAVRQHLLAVHKKNEAIKMVLDRCKWMILDRMDDAGPEIVLQLNEALKS